MLEPGNVDGAERFPEFCLHSDAAIDDIDDSSYYSQASTSARSSTISSVSTFISTADSCSSYCSVPREEETEKPQRQQSHQSSPPRSRRDKQQLQAARLQRAASTSSSLGVGSNAGKDRQTKTRRFQRSTSGPAEALAAVEPPHDQGLTRMAFAEQQRWITVQQKTFTKWCAHFYLVMSLADGFMTG